MYESRDKEAVRTDLTCVEAMTSLTPQQLRGEYIQDRLRGGGRQGMPNKDTEQIIYVPPLKCDIHMSKCYFPKDNLRLNEM